ncbi:hypothetical protein BJV78DRAFT_1157542 [Lactifluus subvellereus]|nr:hypothetical protein BJV78DRAFT_1157542 [Lactifluus subvellereus]
MLRRWERVWAVLRVTPYPSIYAPTSSSSQGNDNWTQVDLRLLAVVSVMEHGMTVVIIYSLVAFDPGLHAQAEVLEDYRPRAVVPPRLGTGHVVHINYGHESHAPRFAMVSSDVVANMSALTLPPLGSTAQFEWGLVSTIVITRDLQALLEHPRANNFLSRTDAGHHPTGVTGRHPMLSIEVIALSRKTLCSSRSSIQATHLQRPMMSASARGSAVSGGERRDHLSTLVGPVGRRVRGGHCVQDALCQDGTEAVSSPFASVMAGEARFHLACFPGGFAPSSTHSPSIITSSCVWALQHAPRANSMADQTGSYKVLAYSRRHTAVPGMVPARDIIFPRSDGPSLRRKVFQCTCEHMYP